MSDAAPPAWVRKLELPSGAWRCLVGLWGFARYTEDGPAKVWPSRATLAEATGQSAHAVAKQLRKLAALGWIRRPEGATSTVFELAWVTPWGQDGPTRTQLSSDPSVPDSDPAVPDSDTGRSEARTQDGPLTLQGTLELPCRNVGATRAPKPKPKPDKLPEHAARAVSRARRQPEPTPADALVTPELLREIRTKHPAAAVFASGAMAAAGSTPSPKPWPA